MNQATDSRRDGYTFDRAINDVFGTVPLWPWSVLAVMLLGGMAGAGISSVLTSPGIRQPPAYGTLACMSYGLLAAAFLTMLPRSIRLLRLRSALNQQPINSAGDRLRWPLQLLAAALRGTPDLRRTEKDFNEAVERAASEFCAILSYRLWPVCIAAFVAPVLGLLSAWRAGKQIEVVAGQTSGEVLMAFLPQVAPPMVATISLSLLLLVMLFILDRGTQGILQRWASSVRFTDGECELVKQLIGNQLLPVPPLPSDGFPTPSSYGSPQADEGPTVDSLDDLRKAFSQRGNSH